jgi:hypothetical protein
MTLLSLGEFACGLGGEVAGGQVLAPGPGHSRSDRSMCVKLSPDAPNGFVVFSHSGDDFAICRRHVCERLGPEREPRRHSPRRAVPLTTEPGREAFVQARLASVIRELSPLRRSPGETYLRVSRGIDTAAIADVLERNDAIGWHPAVRFNEPGQALHGQRLGCIVGVMTDPVTASPTGAISRTYIDKNLHKVCKAKTLGSPAGLVRLTRDEDVTCGLCLAEGLETALSAMAKGFRPVWSTGSTALMKTFPVLSGIDYLTVIADHDASGAGEAAAREVEARWRRARREAGIFIPESPGDLNDLLQQGRG